MSTITTRSGKGAPLTNNEVDSNFTNLNTDKAELSGATFTGEITANGGIALGDNGKAIFGSGSDLQIFHDGDNSYIQDSGSGNLRILVGDLQIRNYGSNENVITSTSNAEVALYHNASQKLATTSTGIDVLGTASMDGLTVSLPSNAGNTLFYGGSQADRGLEVGVSNADGFDNSAWKISAIAPNSGSTLTLATRDTDRLKIYGNGDISFYEDTGTTAKLFWDASAESLGIGTSSPNTTLQVSGANSSTNADALFSIQKTTEGYGLFGGVLSSGASWLQGGTSNDAIDYSIVLQPNGGNVGIGTSSPITKFHIGAGVLRTNTAKTYTSFHSSIDFDNFRFGLATAIKGGATSADRYVSLDSATYTVSTGSFGGGTALVLQELGGNVGIGTSSPVSLLTVGSVSSTNHFSVARENAVITGTDVTVSATQAGMLDILSTSLAGVGKSTSLTFTQNTSQYIAGWDKVLGAIDVELTSSDNLTADSAMKFYTSAGAISSTLNERMRIDSSGNVGIGTSTPSNTYGTNLHVHSTATSSAIKLTNSSTGTGGSDGFELFGSGVNTYLLNREAGFMYFGTSNTEAMRIDSSGNVLVGKTASGFSTDGIELANGGTAGKVQITRTSNAALFLNRRSSDGDIVNFLKDGTPVGSIRSISGDSIGIGTGDAGLRFVPWSNKITPIDMDNGLNSDGLTTLGDTNKRFKDLYLSGGVYLGGTGAANLLEDYEEGTWSPIFADASTGGNVATVGSRLGTYTKVGNLVTVGCNLSDIDITGLTSSNAIYIRGLPFTVGSTQIRSGSAFLDRVTFSGYVTAYATGSHVLLFNTATGASDAALLVSSINSTGSDVFFTLQYQV